MEATILVGDVLARLRDMPECSVQCVVTSPPYWGLRDYGTAEWEGGDPDCDHKPSGNWRDPKKNPAILSSNGHGPKSGKLGSDCSCGARRLDKQIGLEPTPAEYLSKMVLVFREVRRVLRDDGVCWVNMGDSYNGQNERSPSILGNGHLSYRAGGANMQVRGLKAKDMIGMPWKLAFALQDDGWYLRQDIIWSKTNPMPESVSDRCTKGHEYIFLLSKCESYFFDTEAIKEKASTNTHSRGGGINPKAKKSGQHSRMRASRDPRHVGRGRSKQNESFSAAVNEVVTHRNKRSVWTIATVPFKKAHFATFPPSLPRTCIDASTSAKGRCSICGRPFRRITEKFATGRKQKMADGWDTGEGAHGSIHREGRTQGEKDIPVIETRTVGWESECCELFGGRAVPCVVLDPFAGAGTTGLVSLQLGRDFVGIELNPEYAALAQERINSAAGLAAEVKVIG